MQILKIIRIILDKILNKVPKRKTEEFSVTLEKAQQLYIQNIETYIEARIRVMLKAFFQLYYNYLIEQEELQEIRKLYPSDDEFLSQFPEYTENIKEDRNQFKQLELEKEEKEEYLDEFELARRKRKEIQKIFDYITWSIFFLGLILSFCLIFIWKMRFIDYMVYLTSLWANVYLIAAINYDELKDLPPPVLSENRITL